MNLQTVNNSTPTLTVTPNPIQRGTLTDVTVTVTNADGDPLNNTEVYFGRNPDLDGPPVSTTDTTGSIHFTIQPDSETLTAAAITETGAEVTTTVDVTTDTPAPLTVDVTPQTIPTNQSTTITTTVTRDGTPVTNTTVTIDSIHSATTDSTGTASIELTPSTTREYDVTVTDPRGEDVTTQLHSLDVTIDASTTEFTVDEEKTLTLTVTDDTGTPLSDAAVSLNGLREITTRSGTPVITTTGDYAPDTSPTDTVTRTSSEGRTTLIVAPDVIGRGVVRVSSDTTPAISETVSIDVNASDTSEDGNQSDSGDSTEDTNESTPRTNTTAPNTDPEDDSSTPSDDGDTSSDGGDTSGDLPGASEIIDDVVETITDVFFDIIEK